MLSALAAMANLDLSLDGAVPVAAMLQVWRELSDRYTDRADSPDEAMASVLVEQAIRGDAVPVIAGTLSTNSDRERRILPC